MSKPLYLFFFAAISFLCFGISEAYSSVCSPNAGCGNGVPIRYPFWVNNSAQEYCGYPDFGLKCSDHSAPTITLPSHTYYVTDINYDDDTLTLVDMDVVNQSCPRARHNFSIGNFPLSYNELLDVNLSFYFNCSVTDVDLLPPQHIACLNNEGSKRSYVFGAQDWDTTHGWKIDCEEKVVVAVKEEGISSDNSVATGFGEAMSKGFVLDWLTPMDCAKCEDSGGLCGGYTQTSQRVLCFCSDGSISTKSCSIDKEYWECQPSLCGRVGKIDYPFWSDESGRPHYCGRPGFHLYCPQDEHHYPSIQIDSHTFNVTEIDLVSHTMTLMRTDFDICSSHLTNTSESLPSNDLFHYAETSVTNLILLYGCPFLTSIEPELNSFACQPGTSSHSNSSNLNYAIYSEDASAYFDSLMKYCDHRIEVIVPNKTVDANTHDANTQYNYQGPLDALGKGFRVQYKVDEYCGKCLDSHGICGSNDMSPFVCYCRDGHHPLNCSVSSSYPSDSSGHSLKPKLLIGVSGAIGLLLLCITICCFKIKSWRQKIGLCKTSEADQNIEAFITNHGTLALTRYKFADIKKMTDSFKYKLGKGGYGTVYKGKLLNGCPVAVKLLKASKENGEEFINEIASISRTSHVNVVTLLGFCFEGKQKALIYEFMSNGSLDKFIHNNTNKNSLCLTWENLYQIAIGIAHGLEYLHRGCNTRILHFDIKPHNILLDETFCPKISDFGLAKLCLKKESIISISEARGTIGYLAPEVWNRNIGGVSYKSDVYSYGMMLLDMVGARNNMNVETICSTDEYFPDYIYAQLEQDSSLGCNGANNMEESGIAKRMTIVGLWCIQTIPSQRPTMSRVIEMLEKSPDLLEMPPRPVMPSPSRSGIKSSTTTNTTT